jgi:hypothetical protein
MNLLHHLLHHLLLLLLLQKEKKEKPEKLVQNVKIRPNLLPFLKPV